MVVTLADRDVSVCLQSGAALMRVLSTDYSSNLVPGCLLTSGGLLSTAHVDMEKRYTYRTGRVLIMLYLSGCVLGARVLVYAFPKSLRQ